ncbi:hypothetical protein AB3M83_09335 [Microbacterium sp. 179-B 1A2 NHS]
MGLIGWHAVILLAVVVVVALVVFVVYRLILRAVRRGAFDARDAARGPRI